MSGALALTAAMMMMTAATAGPPVQLQTPPRVVVVLAGDDMKYSINEITARRGEVLRIRLTAIGTAPKSSMAHNLVILRPGSNQIAFVEAAAQAKATDYIPAAMKHQMLAATILIGNGESTDIEVTVPSRAGTYPFLCTFPGHFVKGARGSLVVK